MITKRDIYTESQRTTRGTIVMRSGYGFVHEVECDPPSGPAEKNRSVEIVLDRLYGDVRSKAEKALHEMRPLVSPEALDRLEALLIPLIHAGTFPEPNTEPSTTTHKLI